MVFSGASAQRVRSNLYGALLNYLRIGQEAGECKTGSASSETGLNSRLEMSRQEKFRKANHEIILEFGGDNFLDI